ncbi:MAG: Hpt domain-containing protein [Planctomycetales bacterium]|nr:Hpt domain-containing protein [Planctomycetales bacterium]
MTCSAQFIFSTLATDPELGDLVTMYVDEMPDRMTQIREAYVANERDRLIRLIHQLKGAAGSYGFPTLTQAAAATEQVLINNGENAEQAIEELMATCERVRAGAGESSGE